MIFLLVGLSAAVVYLLVKGGGISFGQSQPGPGRGYYAGPNANGSSVPGYQPGGNGTYGYNPASVNYGSLGQSGLGLAGAAGAPASALGPAGAAIGIVGAVAGIIGAKHQEAVKKEASVSNAAVKTFYDSISQIFQQAKQVQMTYGIYTAANPYPVLPDPVFPLLGGTGDYPNPYDNIWGDLYGAVDKAYAAWTAAIQPIRKDGNGPDVVDKTWIAPVAAGPAAGGFKAILQQMSHGVHGSTAGPGGGGYLPAIPDHAGFLGAQRVDFTY